MSLLQMILIAALAGLGGIDLFNMKIHFHRPLVSGAIVGLILGDLQTGLIVGAMFELIWLGAVPVGGAQPPNVVVGGIIGTTFAIITKEEPTTAIGVAMPVAIAMQAAITFLLTAFSGFMHKADKFAEEGNDRGIANINYLCLFILFMFYFVLTFIPIYFGAEVSQVIVDSLPKWILKGLGIAGGLMPAVGFAMLLKTMFRKDLLIFLITGFVFVTFLKLPIIALATLGICFVIYDYRITKNQHAVPTTAAEEEDDFEDGI